MAAEAYRTPEQTSAQLPEADFSNEQPQAITVAVCPRPRAGSSTPEGTGAHSVSTARPRVWQPS